MTQVPNCSICKNPMIELVEKTEQTHERIYVCAGEAPDPEKVNKRACDGAVYQIASKRI